MKKVLFAILATTLLFGTFAAAATLTSAAAPVAITVNVPETLFISGSVPAMSFTINPIGNASQTPSALPKYTLTYNLNHRAVTVCAWVTPLQGTNAANVIPASAVAGQMNGNGSGSFTPFVGDCGGQVGNAMTMDTIANATVNPSKAENFTGFGIFDGAAGPTTPADTYTGTLNVFVQAI